MIRILATGAAVALFAMAGCGGDDGKVSRTGPSKPEELSNGQLDRRPTPLRIEDVANAKPGSPERAVLEVMFWGQWGSPQGVLAQYSPRVVRATGAQNIAGIYESNRDYLASTLAQVETTKAVGRRRVVALRLLTEESPPRAESFLLTPAKDGWRIIYDSFVENSLAGYVQTAEQQARHPRAPDDATPDPAAVAAGRKAVAEYRRLFLPGSRGG